MAASPKDSVGAANWTSAKWRLALLRSGFGGAWTQIGPKLPDRLQTYPADLMWAFEYS
jgi:hypothetical protein